MATEDNQTLQQRLFDQHQRLANTFQLYTDTNRRRGAECPAASANHNDTHSADDFSTRQSSDHLQATLQGAEELLLRWDEMNKDFSIPVKILLDSANRQLDQLSLSNG